MDRIPQCVQKRVLSMLVYGPHYVSSVALISALNNNNILNHSCTLTSSLAAVGVNVLFVK